MVALAVFFALSIGFSFLCSILEAVLLSITPSYINSEVQKQSSVGKALQSYKEDIDKPLSAILTLNTIAHTVGAIGVGAMASKVFGSNDIDFGLFSLSYESLIAGFMTLAILILSEIIPKTIGANNWKSLAPFTVSSIKVLLFLLAPFVWISQFITKRLKSDKEKSVLSRSDFMAMTQAVTQSGEIEASESKIINNVLNFEKLIVRDIMTPKSVAFMANENLSLEEFYKEGEKIKYSRIPVYSEQRDNITGIVLKDDLLQLLADDKKSLKLSEIKKDVNFVSDGTSLSTLFNSLSKSKTHLSAVADEFGNVVGVVSLEDIFETLLGQEIVDETDDVEDLQELAKKKWQEKQNKKS